MTPPSNLRSPLTDHSGHNKSWRPPPRGSLKINVDAHLSSDDHWFSGLILRREDGSAVGAATRSHEGTDDAILGESLGLNDVLDWLERDNISEVVIEMDNQIVVNAVKRKASIRKDWGAVVNRCVSFLIANPNSTIAWINRKSNRVAHELAIWTEQEPNSFWPNSFPSCISNHILK
ncbi:cytochrome P450, partial [Trifolium medium]|nr:cytochrome P450 [Trifolium medium]